MPGETTRTEAPALPAPWAEDPHRLAQRLCHWFKCKTAAVAAWDVAGPAPDELFLARGIEGQALESWIRQGVNADPLARQAMADGVAVAGREQVPQPLSRAGHLLVAMLPADLQTGRWWWLMLGRDKRAFGRREREGAAWLLEHWYRLFHQAGPSETGRLVLGHDFELHLMDLKAREKGFSDARLLEQIASEFGATVAQRFPDIPRGGYRDCALNFGEESCWVCFHHGRALDLPQADWWFLELRSLEAGELPVIGPIEDERVARAVAYLHEHFDESPSLNQVAHHARVSPFHFHRLFTKVVGLTPKHYLLRKQVQVGKWLLRSTTLPVGKIATQCGFSSHGHFTSTFRRQVGLSPSEYRRNHSHLA